MEHVARMRSILSSFPPFTPLEPVVWFGLMRSYFTAYDIRSGYQQYHCFLIVLDLKYESIIRDLILQPPSEEVLSDEVGYREAREELFERICGIGRATLPGSQKVPAAQKTLCEKLRESPFPPFLPHNPALWFAYMNSYFVVYNITSVMQQYHTYLISVGPEYVGVIRDLVIRSPSEQDLADEIRYRAVKDLLFRRLSAHRTIRQIDDEETGVKKTAPMWSEGVPFPPFMPDDVQLWIFVMRSFFVACNIRSGLQQYHILLIAVGPEYVDAIKDLILLPPPEESLRDNSSKEGNLQPSPSHMHRFELCMRLDDSTR